MDSVEVNPPNARKDTKIMRSAEEICSRYNWSRKTFSNLVKLGLPVRKVGSRWYGLEENIYGWFREYTAGSQPIRRHEKPTDHD